jgi:hypothetical protein
VTGRKLTCWKEISSYLGRGIRTVQRYERLFGLPVRRLDDERPSAVWAWTDELDEWMARKCKPLSITSESKAQLLERIKTLEVMNAELRQHLLIISSRYARNRMEASDSASKRFPVRSVG